MSELFSLYGETVTIYNKYFDTVTRKEVYQKKNIPFAIWNDSKASNILATGGEQSADQAFVYIPYDQNKAGFRFPVDWNSLSTKIGLWTLQVGDLVLRGIGPDLSDSYTPSDFRKEFDNVLSIRSIDIHTAGSLSIRHWKVGIK